LFGTVFVGFGIIAELRYGVIERLQVTPISRVACCSGALRDSSRRGADRDHHRHRDPVRSRSASVTPSWPSGSSAHRHHVLVGLWRWASRSGPRRAAPLLNAVVLPALLLSGILLPMSLALRGCSASPTSTRCRTSSTPAVSSSTVSVERHRAARHAGGHRDDIARGVLGRAQLPARRPEAT
jgi:hypothetical protein